MRSFSLPGFLLLALGFSSFAGADGNEMSRPLIARPATTTSSFNMDIYASYVDGQALQEADDFRGWTAGFDFTLPLNQTMQLRVLLPLRTEGEAVLRSNGAEIDIEGWGGVFDFATLFFEHQLLGRDSGANRFAYFLGAGYRTGVLETGTPDRYNHQGRSLHAGARYERHLASHGVLFLDAEYRSYEVSDDLNPANANDDRFNLFRVTGAWMGTRRGSLTPAVEVSMDVVEDYVAAVAVPELFLRAGDTVELKLGVPVGITRDAPDWGAQLRATLVF